MPLADTEDLIREKTGADKNLYGAYFKMNPVVSDIPAGFKHVSGKVMIAEFHNISISASLQIINVGVHSFFQRREFFPVTLSAQTGKIGLGMVLVLRA